MSLSAFCSPPILHNGCLQHRKFEPLKAVAGLERRAHYALPVIQSRIVERRGRPKPSYKKLQIVAGLPLVSSIPIVGPIVNFVVNPALLTVIYVVGAIQFISGFSQTTYSDTVINRFGLTAMWPVLFLASKSFRENFKKAVTS